MNRRWYAPVTVVVLLWPTASTAQLADRAVAQFPPTRPAVAQDTTGPRSTFTPLRVAKWSTLGLATVAGVYGFIENDRADDRYSELERMCEDQRGLCSRRTESGAYEDPTFETLFQSVRHHDRRAHSALVAGQIGVAASVVFFLLDLGNARSPEDIPWTPGSLLLERNHGVVSVGIQLPTTSQR